MRRVAVPERGAEALYGTHDENLRFLESSLKVRIKSHGSELLVGWRELLAPRPLFKGHPITPAPMLGTRDPGGTRVETSSGAIAIHGTYGNGPVRFGFRALTGGAELTIAPVRPGARYRLLVFTPAGTGGRDRDGVLANGARWRFDAPITVRREPGWHSGPVERLDALRVEARPRGARLTIRISAR